MCPRLVGLVFTVLWLLPGGNVWARPKTDTVWTDKGDRVVCEIKELSSGKLKVKTNDMGTFDIDWKHIVALQSSYYYRMDPRFGGHFFGSLRIEQGDPNLYLRGPEDTLVLHTGDVVAIVPIARKFWERFDGSLSLGFSYTKASRVAQLTLDWTNIYKTEKDVIELKVNTIVTVRDEEEDSTAQTENISLGYSRLLVRKLSASITWGYQRNDELGLKRRISLSPTVGVSPLQSNLHRLTFSLGASVNSELGTSDTSEVKYNSEGVIKATYSLFKYSSPKTDINTTLAGYPSFTEKDRYRFDFNFKFRRELVKDFFFDISYYLNYDSKPATESAAQSDYGIVTSVSWSY